MPLPSVAAPAWGTKSSPYIPYHRVGPHLLSFTLKIRCFFRRGNSPCRCRPPPTRIGPKNILSPSISPSRTTFWDILPQKTVDFSCRQLPMTPWPRSRPVRQRKHPSIFHITELGRFCGHFTSKIGAKKEEARPHCGLFAGGINQKNSSAPLAKPITLGYLMY